MRGVYCDGRSARLRVDLPEPRTDAPGSTRLAVRVAGICETDLQLARGYMDYRGILGHEFVGVGPDGRRYVAEINQVCHDCPTCRAGRPHHCPNRTVLGILGADGAMADAVVVASENLHAIPDSLDDRRAVFVEPLAAAFRIAEQVDLGPGVSVAIVGDGKLGLLCAWVARLAGSAVHLVGKHPEKLALAGDGIETRGPESLGPLRSSLDVVVDCTGSPSGLPTALTLVRPCGTVVLKTTIAGDHSARLAPIVIDEVRLLGSRCGPFPPAIDALSSGRIDPTPLIGDAYPLDAADAAFEAAGRRGARKILLEM